jgi:hypothetical protein
MDDFLITSRSCMGYLERFTQDKVCVHTNTLLYIGEHGSRNLKLR